MTDHPQPRPQPPAPPSPSLQPELSHVPALSSDPTCAGSCALTPLHRTEGRGVAWPMRPRSLRGHWGRRREPSGPHTAHSVESCPRSGQYGEGRRDPRDNGCSHSPAAPAALGPGCGRPFAHDQNELSRWLRDQSPQGPQVPSLPFLTLTPPHLSAPPGRHLRLQEALQAVL